jgi:tRNA/tmRNA/rRNA uracil-C5-methylase (TrmA/RlmC/RlmD family)
MFTAESFVVTITDLSRGGAGVARDETGRVIFVPLTAPGDRVRIRIIETKKRYAQAELLEILESSSQRQNPPCPVFGHCGGCQWQHLAYELQWQTKVRGVRHALTRVAIDAPQVWDERPAERIWEYRNRIQLRGVRRDVGFFAPRSHDLVQVNRCDIARPEINAVWEEIRQEGAKLSRPYKVEVEVMPRGQIQKSWNSPHAITGFRQVHDEQNEKLQAWILEALTSGYELFDLFGGTGNFSLSVAKKMAMVQCIDVSAPVVAPAGTPGNVRFHRSAVLSWLLRQVKLSRPCHLPRSAIVDPPREGLGADLSEIGRALEVLGVRELIAVGCDPDSWARDISRLIKRRWRLDKVLVADLFPQTPHVESVALLRYPCE